MTDEEKEDLKKLWENRETIYISKENFDALVKRLEEPPDPKVVERLKEIMSKKAPWE